ncbi:MAG: hypothetical protein ACFB9M_07955 [Myxococcota bacterium]
MSVFLFAALTLVGADARAVIVMEVDESILRVQETWDLRFNSSAEAEAIRIRLAKGAERAETVTEGWRYDPEEGIKAEGAKTPGRQDVVVRYRLPRDGDRRTLEWQAPSVPVEGIRLAFPNLPGLAYSTSRPGDEQVRDSAGLSYRLIDVPAPFAGGNFLLRLTGLPSRPTWPPYAAVGLSLVLVVMTAIAALRQTQAPAPAPLHVSDRPEPILEALRLLEAEAPELPAREVRRRRKELLARLAEAIQSDPRSHEKR